MKKLLLTVLFGIGLFGAQSIQAQDYVDLIRFTDGTSVYEMIVGEDGFTAVAGEAQNLGCAPAGLTNTGGIRLLKDSDTNVSIYFLSADGTATDLGIDIPNTPQLNPLFLVLNGVFQFDRLNAIFLPEATATVTGNSISFN